TCAIRGRQSTACSPTPAECGSLDLLGQYRRTAFTRGVIVDQRQQAAEVVLLAEHVEIEGDHAPVMGLVVEHVQNQPAQFPLMIDALEVLSLGRPGVHTGQRADRGYRRLATLAVPLAPRRPFPERRCRDR